MRKWHQGPGDEEKPYLPCTCVGAAGGQEQDPGGRVGSREVGKVRHSCGPNSEPTTTLIIFWRGLYNEGVGGDGGSGDGKPHLFSLAVVLALCWALYPHLSLISSI